VTARTIGVAIVCAPFASALLLGLGWAAHALINRYARTKEERN
jgi:hypothetical protein